MTRLYMYLNSTRVCTANDIIFINRRANMQCNNFITN